MPSSAPRWPSSTNYRTEEWEPDKQGTSQGDSLSSFERTHISKMIGKQAQLGQHEVAMLLFFHFIDMLTD